jgi:hypothetical protein
VLKSVSILLQISALTTLLALSMQQMPVAFAQQDELDTELMDAELKDEAPPPAEYPYPGAKDEEFKKPPPTAATAEEIRRADVERPVKIDPDDGTYIYSTKTEAPKTVRPGAEAPRRATKSGEFIYKNNVDENRNYKVKNSNEQPVSITADGQFRYKTETTPENRSASIHLGYFVPSLLKNPVTESKFKDLYKGNDMPTLLGDYEWRLSSGFGRLGIKGATGIFSASGTGEFKTKGNRRANDVPSEKFTFLLFPNQLTAIYKFQYADEQLLVPYVEGGAGYFTFVEARDDGDFKFGGAGVTVAAVGANILLDRLDRNSVRQLDLEYGINHVWLNLEYRMILGLNENFDFTSDMASVGLLMDF